MKITPKNWKQFQHYKDRNPVWIKLHRSLLNDYEWHCLPVASKALAPCLWLLASEYQDGTIDAPEKAIAFRLHMSVDELMTALKPLIDNGFFKADSTMLAERYQDACLETERETETETEREKRKILRSPKLAESEFAEFWNLYPRKTAKGSAEKAWAKAVKESSAADILAGLRSASFSPDPQYIPHPATWLNQRRWEDAPPQRKLTLAEQYAASTFGEEAVGLLNFDGESNG
jgi:hypothetical protein